VRQVGHLPRKNTMVNLCRCLTLEGTQSSTAYVKPQPAYCSDKQPVLAGRKVLLTGGLRHLSGSLENGECTTRSFQTQLFTLPAQLFCSA